MAMGGQGLMKVHHYGHSNGNRGKPYGLMILLAFGAAILGVMVLHKVRERRVFNLLVKEKDQELTSLHLLLQKERDHAREVKWKLEEMKTKVYTLRAQKRGFDSRIVEMQSTISSLREEQRTIELALDEKQNEIKMMRERYTEASNDNPQVIALSEMLRQKEYEVEVLKNRLETPLKVWSVSTDDPSSANINLQTTTSVTVRDDTKAIKEIETSAGLQEPTNREAEKNATELADGGNEPAEIRNEQYATHGEDTRKDGGETVDSRGKITGQTEKVVDPKEIYSEHGNRILEESNTEEERNNSNESQTGEASGIQEEKNSQIQAVENHDNEGPRFRDEIHMENEVLKTTEDGLQGRTSISEGAENQESGMSYKGGMKLEMSHHPQIGRNSLVVEGHLKKTKRKKLSKIHKTRKNTENSIRNGAAATSNRRFTEGKIESEMDKDGYQGTMPRNENQYKSLSVENDSGSEDHKSKIVDKLLKNEFPEKEINDQGGVEHGEEQKDLDMTQASKDISQGIELLRHDKDVQELSNDRNTTTRVKVEKSEIVNDTSKSTELHISLKDMPTNTTLDTEDEILSKTKQQNNFEPENQATSIQQPEERKDAHYKDEVSEQADPVNKEEEPDNPQLQDATQTQSETDASRESVLHSEADGKSYNEGSEEPEF